MAPIAGAMPKIDSSDRSNLPVKMMSDPQDDECQSRRRGQDVISFPW